MSNLTQTPFILLFTNRIPGSLRHVFLDKLDVIRNVWFIHSSMSNLLKETHEVYSKQKEKLVMQHVGVNIQHK